MAASARRTAREDGTAPCQTRPDRATASHAAQIAASVASCTRRADAARRGGAVTSVPAIAPAFPSARRSRCWSARRSRSEEHTSELQSHSELVCRLLLEKKKHEPMWEQQPQWVQGFLRRSWPVAASSEGGV